MDAHHFDSLARSLADLRSRRGALATVVGGALGVAGLAETDAKKKKKRKKKKKCGGQTVTTPPPPPPPAPFCASKNTCVARAQCNQPGTSPPCFCYVAAKTGVAFCGREEEAAFSSSCPVPEDPNNPPCGPGEICVDIIGNTGIGCLANGAACVTPCPNPL